MKKIFLLLALLSLTALCLFSCGNPEEESSSTEGSQSASESESKTEGESSTVWNDPEWTPPVK